MVPSAGESIHRSTVRPSTNCRSTTLAFPGSDRRGISGAYAVGGTPVTASNTASAVAAPPRRRNRPRGCGNAVGVMVVS
ncbi:hypothetical protein N599_19860 [Saccharopolyspora erythraea D]|nr:hypothetical protein N599_19860 [Saccharopolyspora erythraea D]